MKQTFEQWMEAVDRKFIRTFGIGSASFPDYMWRDAFDSEQTPSQAFTDYLVAEGVIEE